MSASLCAPPTRANKRERVQHRQYEGGAGVAPERAGQLGDAVGDEGHAGHRLQPQQKNGEERVVEAERGRPARQHEEERPVGGGRVEPERVDAGHVGTRAERARAVVVRVDVVAHHLALGRVGEHVAAEERGHRQQREDPQGEHVGQGPDRHAGPRPQRLVQAEPDAHEQHHAAVDGDHARQHQRVRRPVGLAEEPSAAHPSPELEGRARQRGADADGEDGDEAEQRRAAQEGPVVGVALLGLHALGQREARREAQAQRLGPHGQTAQARADPVEDLWWGLCAVVHSAVRLVPSCRAPPGKGQGHARGALARNRSETSL